MAGRILSRHEPRSISRKDSTFCPQEKAACFYGTATKKKPHDDLYLVAAKELK